MSLSQRGTDIDIDGFMGFIFQFHKLERSVCVRQGCNSTDVQSRHQKAQSSNMNRKKFLTKFLSSGKCETRQKKLTLFSQVRQLSVIGHSTRNANLYSLTWTVCRKKVRKAFCCFSLQQSVCQLAAEQFYEKPFLALHQGLKLSLMGTLSSNWVMSSQWANKMEISIKQQAKTN